MSQSLYNISTLIATHRVCCGWRGILPADSHKGAQMTPLNQQLRSFYAKQKLSDKHRRAALKHDRRRIRQERAAICARHRQPYVPAYDLWTAFGWADSREGPSYWANRV